MRAEKEIYFNSKITFSKILHLLSFVSFNLGSGMSVTMGNLRETRRCKNRRTYWYITTYQKQS